MQQMISIRGAVLLIGMLLLIYYFWPLLSRCREAMDTLGRPAPTSTRIPTERPSIAPLPSVTRVPRASTVPTVDPFLPVPTRVPRLPD